VRRTVTKWAWSGRVTKFVILHFLKYFLQCLMRDHSNFTHNLRGMSTKDSYTQWPISGRDPVTLTGSTSVYMSMFTLTAIWHWTDSVFVRTLSCCTVLKIWYASRQTWRVIRLITSWIPSTKKKFGIGLNPLRGFFSPYRRNRHPHLRYATLRMFITFLVLPIAHSQDACMDFNA